MSYEDPARRGGVAGDSFLYLLATLGSLAFGIVSGILTARLLGPSDRGLYSVVILLTSLGTFVGSLGLGDAAVVEVRTRRGNPSALLGATCVVVASASVVTGALLAVMMLLTLDDATTGIALAAALGVVVGAANAVLGPFLVATGGTRLSSFSFLVTSAGASLTLLISLTLFGGGIATAVLATSAGGLLGGSLLLMGLRRRGLSFAPRRDRAYIGRAVRYGSTVQVGLLLSSLTGRADLLVVYALLGRSQAGQYSVALTLAFLAASAPLSIGYGAFPRLASTGTDEALDFVQRTLRAAGAVVALSSPPLVVGALTGIPILYGSEYRSAVLPAAILVVSGALNGLLLLSARLAAALGRPGVLPQAASVFLCVMLAADVALIPSLGLLGAGLSAVVGAIAGLLYANRSLGRILGQRLGSSFIPGGAEFQALLHLPLVTLGRRRRA